MLCEKAGLNFRPVPQRVMSPRKSIFNRCAYEVLRTARDSVMGLRYLVGFLECAPMNPHRTGA